MEIKGKKIAFLGDSITAGVGASNPDNVYHQVLKSMAELETVYNYGINGTRIACQSIPSSDPGFDHHFATRVDDMVVDCDIVVVFGGTNDYKHGDASFGNFEDRQDNTFYGALHLLLQKLIQKYPDKYIVFVTPLHRLGDTEPSSKPDGIFILKNYVDAICEVCEYYSVPVINMYAISGMNPNIELQQNLYFPDGLHPSDLGHKRVADRIYNFLIGL